MNENTHSHRHFVAGPLLALLIGVSVLHAGPAALSQTATQEGFSIETDEGDIVHIAKGVDALVYSGKGFDGTALRSGSALIRITGAATLSAGFNQITAVSGVYHLSYQGDDLTIAALSTPVHVKTDNGEMIVPAGTQWSATKKLPSSIKDADDWFRARTLKPIPQRFVQRQLENVSLLAAQDFDELLPTARSSKPLPKWMYLSIFRLPSAKQEVESAWGQDVLGVLRYAVEQGDVAEVESIFMNETYQEVLPSSLGKRMMSLLLESLPTNSSMTMVLLGELLESQRLLLLYSLHPRWRDATWTHSANTDEQHTALRIALLPASDVLPESVSVLTVPYWVTASISFASSIADPVPYLEELVDTTSKRVRRAQADGYPERALRWAAALQDVEEGLSINLPEGTQEKITALQSIGSVDTTAPIVLPQTELVEETVEEIVAIGSEAQARGEVVEEIIEPEGAYSPDIVESRTLSVLSDMGAIFTVETTVAAVAPNTAHVQGIIFSTTEGDYTFDFKYDVVKGEISELIRNNKEFPYALSVEAFKKWIY